MPWVKGRLINVFFFNFLSSQTLYVGFLLDLKPDEIPSKNGWDFSTPPYPFHVVQILKIINQDLCSWL